MQAVGGSLVKWSDEEIRIARPTPLLIFIHTSCMHLAPHWLVEIYTRLGTGYPIRCIVH
jgi:hypothetical protein